MTVWFLIGVPKIHKIFQKKYDYWLTVILYSTSEQKLAIFTNPISHDGIGEATIAIDIKFSCITIILDVDSDKSYNSLLYLCLFQIFRKEFSQINHAGVHRNWIHLGVMKNCPHRSSQAIVERYLREATAACY